MLGFVFRLSQSLEIVLQFTQTTKGYKQKRSIKVFENNVM